MSAALALLETVSPTFPRSSRYRLGQAVADGPTGPVYLGFQRGAAGFERIVVVRAAPPDDRETILAELARTSAIRHANLIPIDDVEEHDGELYLISEYVEGTSLAHLADLASERRIPPPIALRIALDVCTALEAIHDAGFVHRHVSRQRVFVGSDGITRLTDFGLPELARGPVRGPRAIPMQSDDTFAFGALLWEMLTGRTAPKHAPKQMSKAQLVSSVVSDMPPLFDASVAKAIGIWPLERFDAIHETRMALEGAAHGYIASHEDVADFVSSVARDSLEVQRTEIRAKAFVTDDITDEIASDAPRASRPTFPSSPEISVIRMVDANLGERPSSSLKTDLAKLALALFLVAALCLTTAFACGALFR